MHRVGLLFSRCPWLAPLLSFGSTTAITAIIMIVVLGNDNSNPTIAGPPDIRKLAISETAIPPQVGTAPSITVPSAPQPTTTTQPKITFDYPDLVVSEVFARDNRLVVIVHNKGSGNVVGPINVRVDNGPAHRVDVGKPLRPGEYLKQALNGEYVQQRAAIVVTVYADASLSEENAGNNVFSGIVTPDVPIDLALMDIAYGETNSKLMVTILNSSPIPLKGVITIGIRQTTPQNQLLLREDRELNIESGTTQTFDFFDVSPTPLESLHVIVSSDSINDADSSNNTWPR